MITHPEVAARLAQSDIALVPSLVSEHGWQETFSLVALEAMSCGKPVIATDTSALQETVAGGGRIVRRGDPVSLADAISALLAETTPESCRDEALARARQFSTSRMVDEYDALATRMAGLSGTSGLARG
jgi:glycosyltransferase involved in cell wall biosynthesis